MVERLPNPDIPFFNPQIGPQPPALGPEAFNALPKKNKGGVTPLTPGVPSNISAEPEPLSQAPTKLSIPEARALVAENSAIADVSVVRSAAFDRVGEVTDMLPADAVLANRSLRLAEPELARFLAGCIDVPAIRDLVIARTGAVLTGVVDGDPKQESVPVPPLAPFVMDDTKGDRLEDIVDDTQRIEIPAENVAGSMDPYTPDGFSRKYDVLVPVFREVFKDEALLSQWMSAVDSFVTRSSEENLAEIDAAEARGERVKKDFVIVGGGLLTAFAASVLGPYYDVTVITDQDSIGEPWRHRPLYINSSVAVEDVNGVRLPLLDGSTTPMSLAQQLDTLDTDALLGGDSLTVTCDDGTEREYVSGPKVGKFAADIIAKNAKDYIVGQTVDTGLTVYNFDGTTDLTFTDSEGRERSIDANAVLYLGGPGVEEPVFPDNESNVAYIEAGNDVKEQINRGKKTIAASKKRIRELQVLQRIGEESDPAKTDADIAALKAQLESVTLTLPQTLNLTMIEQSLAFWDRYLDRDPARYPLADLLVPGKNIANIGNGDTARIIDQLLRGDAPIEMYPDNFDFASLDPLISNYNIPQSTPAEFDEVARPRYRGVIKDENELIPYKVDRCVTETNIVTGARAVVVTNLDAAGGVERRKFDYAIVATGITRVNVEDELGIDRDLIKDKEGYTVGIGSETLKVLLGGAAAGLKKSELPEPLQNIIDGLGVSENTISAWVNTILLERLLWTFIEREGINEIKAQELALAA